MIVDSLQLWYQLLGREMGRSSSHFHCLCVRTADNGAEEAVTMSHADSRVELDEC